MQDFIEWHITESMTLHMLAQAAGYSPWHAARIFKEVTGKNPFDYIRELRLTRAAVKLQGEDVKIVDVAFDFVFGSHEGFTRAFSKQFGMSPRQYSKEKPPVKLFMPEQARDYYLSLQRGEKLVADKTKPNTIFVQVVDRPARKLILKRGIKATHYFEYCDEVGCDVEKETKAIKDALYEPCGMWLPENLRKPGTSEFVMGVEMPADYAGEVPNGYDIIDLKPCKMMVFQGPPFEDAKFGEAINDLWEVLETYNPELYGFKWADEDGPRLELAPLGYRGHIELLPVRQLNVKK
jgi:AraC-like DNA-binding protein